MSGRGPRGSPRSRCAPTPPRGPRGSAARDSTDTAARCTIHPTAWHPLVLLAGIKQFLFTISPIYYFLFMLLTTFSN